MTSPSSNTNSPVFRQQSLTRGLTMRQRVHLVQRNILRPFRLANQPSSPYPHDSSPATTSTSASTTPSRSRSDNTLNKMPGLEKVQQRIHHLRSPSQPTFLAKALHSDREQSDMVSLPFRLNVASVHDKVQRNMPYLRHSWGRIDFVAITSFWITFGLATAGLERGSHHIGIFRAMSVLRTARLLAISSGTTVSNLFGKLHCHIYFTFYIFQTIMRSLKTARPLLTSVAYFVLFAMVLFSYVSYPSTHASLI